LAIIFILFGVVRYLTFSKNSHLTSVGRYKGRKIAGLQGDKVAGAL
jgi:hypothetical protein